MGWLRRLVQRFDRPDSDDRGARLEASGRLDDAFVAYRDAGRHEDAARILLARAEAEPDLVQRKALMNVVLSHAPAGSAVAAETRKRRALVSLEIARAMPGPGVLSECRAIAADLEAAQLFHQAAEAYALANDTDSQTRMLAACGAIDALESTFEAQRMQDAARREREQQFKAIRDLDAIGRRRDALAACQSWLEKHPRDEDISAFARTIQQRLARPGALRAELDGRPVTLVVDHEVVIGRSDASIAVPSPALSRRHLIVRATSGGALVSDAGSRNGTTLAGARIGADIPVGSGLELLLGGQVPVRIEPWPGGGVCIAVSGELFVAPFGPLCVGQFVVDRAGDVMVLRAPSSSPPVLNKLTSDAIVDLCWGDEIRQAHDAPILFKVLAS